MTHSEIDQQSKIDAQLDRVLSDVDEHEVRLAREAINEPDDRWYGQLVVNVHATLTDSPDVETILSAATAIELLRGYIRLRSRLFIQLTDKFAHSLTLDPSTALLAGDYLYTTAFTTLSSTPHSAHQRSIEELANLLETITEAFALTYTSSPPLDSDQSSFIDRTAGSLGEGAAILGASLAGVGLTHRGKVARVGRGFSTARQIYRVLEVDSAELMVVPPILNEGQLCERAKHWRNKAEKALNSLSKTVDVTMLRALVDTDDSMMFVTTVDENGDENEEGS